MRYIAVLDEYSYLIRLYFRNGAFTWSSYSMDLKSLAVSHADSGVTQKPDRRVRRGELHIEYNVIVQ